NRRPSWRTQRHVQDRAMFRDVDFLATEDRVDSLAQPAFLGELDEQAHRLVVDAILRIIQEDAGGLRRHPLATRWIVGEQVSQMAVPHRLKVILEGPPCSLFARRLRLRYLRSYSHVRHPLWVKSVASNAPRCLGERAPTAENRRGTRWRCRLRENAAAACRVS